MPFWGDMLVPWRVAIQWSSFNSSTFSSWWLKNMLVKLDPQIVGVYKKLLKPPASNNSTKVIHSDSEHQSIFVDLPKSFRFWEPQKPNHWGQKETYYHPCSSKSIYVRNLAHDANQTISFNMCFLFTYAFIIWWSSQSFQLLSTSCSCSTEVPSPGSRSSCSKNLFPIWWRYRVVNQNLCKSKSDHLKSKLVNHDQNLKPWLLDIKK